LRCTTTRDVELLARERDPENLDILHLREEYRETAPATPDV
jgi:hypothetical protein